MNSETKVHQLAALLAHARRSGVRLSSLAADLMPDDGDEADCVQDALARQLGPVAAYKVAQVGDAPGTWGAIFATGVFVTPKVVPIPPHDIRAEAEIAFRLGADLPGRNDGLAYVRADIEAAVSGVCLAVELLESRLPSAPKPQPQLARADALGNFGLVVGPAADPWRRFATPGSYGVRLRISGTTVVDGDHRHPSGVDPLHPVVWLANTLARRGQGLRAGQIVTTGAFGSAHPVGPGDRIEVGLAELGTLAFTLTANTGVPQQGDSR